MNVSNTGAPQLTVAPTVYLLQRVPDTPFCLFRLKAQLRIEYTESFEYLEEIQTFMCLNAVRQRTLFTAKMRQYSQGLPDR